MSTFDIRDESLNQHIGERLSVDEVAIFLRQTGVCASQRNLLMALRRVLSTLRGVLVRLLLFLISSFVLSPFVARSDQADVEASNADLDFFEQRIRPLLVERCQQCHGDNKQWAGLRVDSRAAVLSGGDSGPSIVLGDALQSELILRAMESDLDLRMPPPEAGSALTELEIADLSRWIAIGAPWPTEAKHSDSKEELWRNHWAFQPLRSVVPPNVAEGSSTKNGTVKNDIDRFVLENLSKEGLESSIEADRATLIRRATHDLCGLLPTLGEIDTFVKDPGDDAYAHLIDRLLDSPRYGEHWGRHWLDVARYSDTKGYVYGREERRFIHSSWYRDWVIDALNDDMPFDRFVLLQLAADQVAPNDLPSQAAMGFLTLGRRFLGATPDIIDDRIDVVTRGLLGVTVTCARCHDHKYDPFPTADYYSLYGVFQNCLERQVPITESSEDGSSQSVYKIGLRERNDKLRELTVTAREEANARIRTRLRDYLMAQREIDKYPEIAFVRLTTKDDLIPAIVRRWHSILAHAERIEDPIFAPWIAFSKLKDEDFVSQASEVTKRLRDATTSIHPRLAEAFVNPPQSASEVADRYAAVLAAHDQAWSKQLDADSSTVSESERQLHEAFYGNESPCVIPDEPIVNTEWFWDHSTVLELWKAQSEVDQWILQAPSSISCAVVLEDRKTRQDAYVFRRGNPSTRGERVPLQFLKVLSGESRLPFETGSGRMEMAKAIVDPNNPLTARVWVNRVWQHHFGYGLVRSLSDFGVRASPPSHPELLDWLTSQFIAGGWSTKSLHRSIMLSATYRQSSRGPKDADAYSLAQERDPDNRLLWRANRRRMQFEALRDTMLAASGDLDLTMGGPGTDLLGARRSIYVTIDRQFLPTLLSVFDFANPDLHSPERSETITPQQALFALNHPFVAARAKKIVTGIRGSDPVSHLYETILGRTPTQAESIAAEQFLIATNQKDSSAPEKPHSREWSYGYGEVDEESGRVKSFTSLPYFTGSVWQGGSQLPDSTLGWLFLTAQGGHPGNDRHHAIVRRWTSPGNGVVSIQSTLIHDSTEGDGIRAFVISSRHGTLKSATFQKRLEDFQFDSIKVATNDTIDFVVDIGEVLNNDQFQWAPTIAFQDNTGSFSDVWQAASGFAGVPTLSLSPVEQLAQVLLISNERMFLE